MQRVAVGRVAFGVRDAAASADQLHLAPQQQSLPGALAVAGYAVHDVSEDLHVAVRMGVEGDARRDDPLGNAVEARQARAVAGLFRRGQAAGETVDPAQCALALAAYVDDDHQAVLPGNTRQV